MLGALKARREVNRARATYRMAQIETQLVQLEDQRRASRERDVCRYCFPEHDPHDCRDSSHCRCGCPTCLEQHTA